MYSCFKVLKKTLTILSKQELVSPGKPFFTVDGMTRFDYEQGSKLGKIYFFKHHDMGSKWSLSQFLSSITRQLK